MCVASLLYAAVWFGLGVWRYKIFRASFDDGIFTQILASAFSGFHGTPEWNFNHFASHFSPDLFLLAPFVIATQSTVPLIALQAIAGALVAPPIFFIARKRMPAGLAAACAILALVYAPLCGLTFADFHENGIEPAAILWLLWAVDAGKERLAIVLGLFALGIKEDVAPGIFFAGIIGGAWLLRRGDARRARTALILAGCACIVFVAYLAVLRPALHPPFAYQQFRFYSYGDAGPLGVLNANALLYLLEIFVPLLGIPLLSPAVVFTVPGLVEIIAANNPITRSFETQYAAVWIGYVLFAFVLGAGVVYRRLADRTKYILTAAYVVSLYVVIVADPMAKWYALYRLPNAHDARLQTLLDSLPKDASIGAPDRIYAHLGFYPNAGIDLGGRYVVIDRTNNDVSPQWAQKERDLQALVAARKYRLLQAEDGIELYERAAS